MEEFRSQKDTLENENTAANESQNGVDNKMGNNQQENEINKLREEVNTVVIAAKNKYDQLFAGKKDTEENNEK